MRLFKETHEIPAEEFKGFCAERRKQKFDALHKRLHRDNLLGIHLINVVWNPECTITLNNLSKSKWWVSLEEIPGMEIRVYEWGGYD